MAGPVADVVEKSKGGDLWRLQCLAGEVKAWLRAEGRRLGSESERDFSIVSVPPRRSQLRRRGFDVPTILAKWLRGAWGGKIMVGAIRREETETTGQTGASRSERHRRALEAYALGRCLRGSPNVVLLDDVVTTGATVGACSRVLADAGAASIRILSLARTPRLRLDVDGATEAA